MMHPGRATLLALALTLTTTGCSPDRAADAEATAEPATQPTTQPATEPATEGSQPERRARPERPGPLEPGVPTTFGAPFTLDGEPLALSAALATCLGTGEPCLVEARVASVCQSSGCWFTLRADDVDRVVRVDMENYGFLLPRNSGGAHARFEGTLREREITAAQARHFARDAVGPEGTPREVTGPEQAYQFTITAVELTLPE